MQSLFDPAPISPKKPLKPLDCNQVVAAARRSAPIVLDTQTSFVPEPSESRYWCISMAVLFKGSCMADVVNASELPDVVQAKRR